MEPISMGIMAASASLGFLKNQASHNARQKSYYDQIAFQDVQQEFNSWQAGFNAERQNLNSQYQFWGERVRYNEQLSYAGQLENYEFAKEIAQAQRVMEARVGAATDYLVNAEAIQAAYRERGISEAVAEQQMMYRGLQQSAAYMASAQEGKSMDRWVRNASKQMGDYRALKTLKQGFAERQYSRNQLSQITRYLNQYNSQQFYVKAPIQKPSMPFAPLPALMQPPQPYMRGGAPADTRFLDNATSAFSALNTGLEVNKSIMNLASGAGSSKNWLMRVNAAFGGTGGKP
ncbi:hypothetical protein [uncultured phage_MedDCM-OCT-S31-C1]|uniref:Internal virion protein n=1 Tax=uncultured phage_MedDCM-OCT-S31-C1 TaxID=2740800 RepID=A0A6S4PD23_9CAUD|nr:hypothetical protein HOQ55_gp15 [uncultured phage_MedDCM-OCT-S31-C1]BAQ94397.1 hypothetical protein [uncultured phage_MedDCM-OCT-S31-C1]